MDPNGFGYLWLACPLFMVVMMIACMGLRMGCGGAHRRGTENGERSSAERPSTTH